MRLRTLLSAVHRRAILGATLVGAAGLGALGCRNDVNLTDPSAPNSRTFLKSATDAQLAVNATYNALLRLGTFQRWQGFAYDMRSDEGTSFSPWPELQAFVKFQFPSGYDFEVNRDIWNDTYSLISRANLVIASVPDIDMDQQQRASLVGEAQFLRGVAYFHLVTLYGGNVPLITTVVNYTDRPASSDSATLFAQIEKDFADAAAVLPLKSATAPGRATKGAAQGMLGKTLLQQRKWAAAAAALQPLVTGTTMGAYSLDPSYGNLFRNTGNNGPEALFEVQMGNPDLINTQGLGGLNIAKMIGPCGPSYCDGRPTPWFYQQFLVERTTTNQVDPRLDATLFYYKGDTTTVYGQLWKDRYKNDTTTVYWKKYGEYYTGSQDQSWEAQINYKVLRYADVLLMYAEALNEQHTPAAAAPFVNEVRRRVGLADLPTTLTESQMRAAILKERLLEFGLEGQRWLDLGRQDLFADLATLKAHDPDFNNFVPRKSVLLPITQTERNLNTNVDQNFGW